MHAYDKAKMVEYQCNDAAKACDALKWHLQKNIPRTVLTFLNQYEEDFDQPTTARYLLGLIKYVNALTDRDLETLHPMVENDVLNVFLNCKRASVEAVLKKPIARDHAEVSASQNLLDQVFFPHEIVIEMRDLVALPQMHHDNWKYKGMIPDGQFALVRDPRIIDQMNFTSTPSNKSVRAPGVTNTTN